MAIKLRIKEAFDKKGNPTKMVLNEDNKLIYGPQDGGLRRILLNRYEFKISMLK